MTVENVHAMPYDSVSEFHQKLDALLDPQLIHRLNCDNELLRNWVTQLREQVGSTIVPPATMFATPEEIFEKIHDPPRSEKMEAQHQSS